MLVDFLFFCLSVLIVYLLAFAFSSNRRVIKHKRLLIILIFQLIFCWLLLQTYCGVVVMNFITRAFNFLITHALEGVSFVFGNIHSNSNNGFILFLRVLMPIVFISALIGILQYLRILPLIVRILGFLLSKITGMGKLESFNAICSITLGQAENFIVYKNIIHKLSPNVLYTLSATAISTVSLAILGSYITIIDPKYVCIAIVLNMFSTFFVLHVINPYDYDKEEGYEDLELKYDDDSKRSFFIVLSEYILDGFKIGVIIAAVLIGYTALISMFNAIFFKIIGITFQDILGYVFYPFAWVLHIPATEMLFAGKVMGTKLVSNELVAMFMLKDDVQQLSQHTVAVVSVFLVSFANLGSVGIIVGAVYALSKRSGEIVAGYGIKILYGAVLVSFLSAGIVGLFV